MKTKRRTIKNNKIHKGGGGRLSNMINNEPENDRRIYYDVNLENNTVTDVTNHYMRWRATWVFDNSEGTIINDIRTMIRTYDSIFDDLIQPPYGRVHDDEYKQEPIDFMRAWIRSRELRMILSKILEEEPIEASLDLNIQGTIVNNIESENEFDEIELPEAVATSRPTIAIASTRSDTFDPMNRADNTPLRQLERLSSPLPRRAFNEMERNHQEEYERFIENRQNRIPNDTVERMRRIAATHRQRQRDIETYNWNRDEN